MEEMISKKELLQVTGISYGQLYRWKREELIPDSWFERKTTFTGQETFFPREKMLARIETILALKDSLSLEELARRLSPELTRRLFVMDEMRLFEEINPEVLMVYGVTLQKFQFTFQDVVLMCALSDFLSPNPLTLDDLRTLISGMIGWNERFTETAYTFFIVKHEGILLALLEPDGPPTLLDTRLQIIYSCSLDHHANTLRIKYDKQFFAGQPADGSLTKMELQLRGETP